MTRTSLILLIASFAVAAGGALAFSSYNGEINLARATVSNGSRIESTPAGPIEFAETGAGVPLLSIHGSGGGYDQGLDIAAELIGDGFHVIAPSRFGYLRTPIPLDVSPSAQADAHGLLLAALKIDKAIVVGTSAGARSAIELALCHPDQVAALILIVPATYAPTDPVAIETSRGSQFAFWLVSSGADLDWWATEKIAPSVLMRFIGVAPEIVAIASPSERERVMRMVRQIQPLSARFSGINIDSKPDNHRPPLELIKAPTLVISARDDLFNTLPAAEFAAATIPAAKLVVFDRGGHLLVGHQGEVRLQVTSFLALVGVK